MKKILALTNRVALFTQFTKCCIQSNLEHIVVPISDSFDQTDPELKQKINSHAPDLIVIDGMCEELDELLKICNGSNVRIYRVKPREYSPEVVSLIIQKYREVKKLFPISKQKVFA